MHSSKRSDAHGRCDAPGPTLRVVLDTCILKLATFPADNNASALIYELARAGSIEAWVSPAILEEYADVLGDHPEFVAEIVETFPVCYPLTELSVIRHEPDNRFLECAFAADAEFIGHGEHGTRALRSEAVSGGARGAAHRIPQRPARRTTGEEAH